jgi:Fic family protein
MKPYPPTPTIDQLLSRIPGDRLPRVLQAAAEYDDTEYLHWERLRHRSPREDGLSAEEQWLALKLKRQSNRLVLPLLRTTAGNPLSVTRHARLDEGFARMDRSLAGQLGFPEPVRNDATRDQYIASSLMEEAIHSSLFEGAVSTREVAKDMLRSGRAPSNRDERMILNNYRAMIRLREMASQPLSLEAILELHRILTDGTLKDPTRAGRLQQPGEVRVNVVDDRLNRIIHAPPPAEQLPERMERLVRFANGDDVENGQYIHPVLRAILLHFQLAYDHPFHDGNGRTARALFYWSMLRRGYWLVEFFSISRLLYQRRAPYERAYLEVESDGQDATYFVLQQLDVLHRSAEELFAYVERKASAQQRLRRRLSDRDDLNHRQLALLDHALRKPGAEYSHDSHASSHRVTHVTARADLRALVDRGFLRMARSGRRVVYRPIEGLERMLDG